MDLPLISHTPLQLPTSPKPPPALPSPPKSGTPFAPFVVHGFVGKCAQRRRDRTLRGQSGKTRPAVNQKERELRLVTTQKLHRGSLSGLWEFCRKSGSLHDNGVRLQSRG